MSSLPTLTTNFRTQTMNTNIVKLFWFILFTLFTLQLVASHAYWTDESEELDIQIGENQFDSSQFEVNTFHRER